jgi:uncharacterized protein YjbJ (UPF0337 family)
MSSGDVSLGASITRVLSWIDPTLRGSTRGRVGARRELTSLRRLAGRCEQEKVSFALASAGNDLDSGCGTSPPRRIPDKGDFTVTRQPENGRTAGGYLGKAVGKIKEAAGTLTDNDALTREGRLQQAQGQAGVEAARAGRAADVKQQEAETRRDAVETDAERARLENEVGSELSKRRAEEDRRETERSAADHAAQEQRTAQRRRDVEQTRAEQTVEHAEQSQVGATEQAQALERAARQAEQRADTIDPEEHS